MIFLDGCAIACEDYTKYYHVSGCVNIFIKTDENEINSHYAWLIETLE